jgi:hypothetical protein
MMITPLQDYLRREVVPTADIQALTGQSRVTIWRWAQGLNRPKPDTAKQLIELFNARGCPLDFNGCYRATITDVTA